MAPAGGSNGSELKGIYQQRKKVSSGGGTKPSSTLNKRSKAKPKAPPTQKQQQSTQLSLAEEEEAELRRFDVDMAYGPCVGVTRLRRWDHAAAMGLRPPPRLRDILLRHCSAAAADNSSSIKSKSRAPAKSIYNVK